MNESYTLNAAQEDKSIVKATEQKLLDTLAELGGRLSGDEDVVFSGTKMVLPETMTLRDALQFISFKLDDEEREYSYSRTFLYRPWDGAYATMNAFRKAFGTFGQKSVMTMFGANPPEMRTIDVGPNESEQVPWGLVTVPSMPGCDIYLSATRDKELGLLFQVNVEGKRKWRHHVQGLFKLIEAELETASLYRGKAIDGQENPKFLDLSGVTPEKVIYSDEATRQLEANLWSLLRYTDTMRGLGVGLKRAVLLEGPYGTGKTLAAYLTAQLAVENDWTFIYCRPGRDDLFEVMGTAKLYQPSVVFFEDVDVVGGAGDADHISQLLDVFDGVSSKGTEIIAVLTTNHAEKIHKGMVRPGRLDSIVHIGTLDLSGITRLVRASIPDSMLDSNIDWANVGASMDGYTPAFVREAADRAMRYVLARNNGVIGPVTHDDLIGAANGLRDQYRLMENAAEEFARPSLEAAFGNMVDETLKSTLGRTVLSRTGDPDDVTHELQVTDNS